MSSRYPLRDLLLVSAAVLGLSHALPAGAAAGGVGDLFVTSDASNFVRAYAGGSGAYLGTFTNSVLGLGELAIHFGPTNNRVLIGHFGGGVDEFNASTGAYIKTYNAGGGWMWSAIYRPNGNVYIAETGNDQVTEWDGITGAFIRVLQAIPGAPSDMRFGPNGHLYVCTYLGGKVFELQPNSGAILGLWSLPFFGGQANDIAFPANGEILVTDMGMNVCFRFDSTPVHTFLGSFAGAGWMRPHGIDIRPSDGHIFVADGVTTQAHEFDPVTYLEITPAFLTPGPGDKIVDLEFRVQTGPTEATHTSWGRLKRLYR